jgi:hypothetical protein
MKAGVTPTTILLGGEHQWTEMDALILNAYQVVTSERCQHCNLPRWLCRNEDARLQVRINIDDCYATSELEKYREGLKDGEKGTALYPEFYVTDGTPLIEFRELYFKQLAAERAEEEDDE